MKNRSTRHQNSRRGPYHCLGITSVLALAIAGVTPTASNAYTAAGDRNFPAQLILPQIGPTDALWFPISTLPMEALKTTDPTLAQPVRFLRRRRQAWNERLRWNHRFQDGLEYGPIDGRSWRRPGPQCPWCWRWNISYRSREFSRDAAILDDTRSGARVSAVGPGWPRVWRNRRSGGRQREAWRDNAGRNFWKRIG